MTRALLLIALLLPVSGCVSLVQRQPNTGLVDELGAGEARKQLKITSSRARDPQIVNVEFDDVGFIYTYNHLAPMTLIPIQAKMSVLYDNLERLDLYENARVFLIGTGGHEMSAITFGSLGDAERWVDLVLSLKHDYLNNR